VKAVVKRENRQRWEEFVKRCPAAVFDFLNNTAAYLHQFTLAFHSPV